MSNISDGKQVGTAQVDQKKIFDLHFLAATNTLLALADDGMIHTFQVDSANGQIQAGATMQSGNGPYRQVTGTNEIAVFRTEQAMVEIRKAASLQTAIAINAGGNTKFASLSSDGSRLVVIREDAAASLWNAADGKKIADLSQDMVANHRLQQREADKAAREARVNVVKGQIGEAEKRLNEHKESLKKADEELTKTTKAKEEADKKLADATGAVQTAQKASEEKPDDANLKKKLEEAQKAEQTAKDGVTTADNQLRTAQKGKQLTEQAIQRATTTVDEKKQLLASAEVEFKTSQEQLEAAKQLVASTVKVTSAAFTADVSILVTVDENNLRLWDAATGQSIDVYAAQPSSILACTADTLITRSSDGQLASLSLFPEWQLTGSLGPDDSPAGSVFADRVLSLAFSPDGSQLAAGGGEASRSGELTLWSIPDGTLQRKFEEPHSDTIYGLEFSTDGKLLATAAADKFVKVFDVATGEHVRSYEGHTHHVMDVSWKGDRTTLVSAGADNAIKVWNAETGEQARTITTYSKQVTSLEFIGMQDNFLSSSGDRRVFLHTASNGKTVREFKGCPDYVYCSATTADGSMIAAGCEDGVLRIWNGADGKEVATFEPN